MTAMQVAERMTADGFIAMPVPDQGRPWNLVNGEVVVNEAGLPHQFTLRVIDRALDRWAEAHSGRGAVVFPIDIRLDPRNVFAPDAMWYSEGRVPARTDLAPLPMPDLAVEVRSASTWRYDIGAKRQGYEKHGLKELWLVDTEAESILVCRRSKPLARSFDVVLELAAGETLTSPLLPGFALPIDTVFADR